MQPVRPSELRIHRVIVISQWVALALGIVAGIIVRGGSPESYLAAAVAGLYVLVTTATPLHMMMRNLVFEAVALSGSLLTMTAVTITGATESPYILLSVMPPVLATLLGGLRVGIATSILSGALLVATSLSTGQGGVIQGLGFALLYILLTLTVGQIRRLMTDAEDRALALEESSAEASKRLELLESTYDLLTRLAELANEHTGPIAVGRAALESITAALPGSSGVAVLNGDNGPVVIARQGLEGAEGHRTRFPLMVGDRDVGAVVLISQAEITDEQRLTLDATLKPVALSFANVLLLERIARTAVEEERSRLARELHDEIGPTLASLGLALDTAVLQAGERDLADHLVGLRASVTELVDDVRTSVADLRSERGGSLTGRLLEGTIELTPPPVVDLELDERRPPRPSIIDDVAAILLEAVRNAHRYAGTDRIRVHGWVDFDRGRVVVEDEGGGFDTEAEHRGHFGLLGMRERAGRIDAEVSVMSSPVGTSVALEWGEQ